MVSRNTSVLLAVAIIAIGAVAIIGVAYAYTASTVNTGNDMDSEYVVLSQQVDSETATGKYTFVADQTIKYSTVNTSTGTTYKIADPATTTVSTYTVVNLGSVTLKATPTGITPASALNLAVTSSGITINDGWVFIISDGTNHAVMSAADTWTGNVVIGYTAGSPGTWNLTTVTLYYGYATASAATGVATAPTNLDAGDTITFTATFA